MTALAHPLNQNALLFLRTARAQGWPVTVLLGKRQNDGHVTEIDRMGAVALTAYEDTICSGCGLPHSITRGDHNVGRVEWKDDAICHGCETLQGVRDDKNRTTFPGQVIYPVVQGHDTGPRR